MSEVKLLNLDDVAPIQRVVQIKGVEYEVADQTVGQMAERLQLTKKIDMEAPEGFIEMLRITAQNILPSAPKSVIDGLTPEQITRLVQFINDRELQESAARMAEEQEKAGATEEPEKKS